MAISGLFLLSACTPRDKAAVDKLNAHSYACHYRNLDSTAIYASRALSLSEGYATGRAAAMNNLAFVDIIRMNYRQAAARLDSIPLITDNQIELLVSYVQQMRLCQRCSHNKDFHDYRERAHRSMLRIGEEYDQLSRSEQERLRYAETEYAIVNSTYYYYVGLERQSIEAMEAIDPYEIRRDTAQYLNYLYNIGAGGFITEGSPDDIFHEEVDILERCLFLSQRYGYIYFEAQAKEALADHYADLQPAGEALNLFERFGDVYQIAGAHRTLASCYHALGDESSALDQLHLALADTTILQAPDLVASIREQLSVIYSALNDKASSDQNRNLYLDLQEQTRQDRELESRAAQYDLASEQLNWMLIAVVGAILLLVFLLWLFNHLNHRRQENNELDDMLEQKADELRMRRLQIEKVVRRSLEQRAKVSMVMSIIPLIDRIRYAIGQLDSQKEQSLHGQEEQSSNSQIEYICELTDTINRQNDLLTQWIQLRQGELNLHIESFKLQPLFDIIARGRAAFDLQGIVLDVGATDAVVKADRALTLFMLNTLTDNARKFTPRGGHVNLRATEGDDYVELSVIDDGQGMTAEVLAHVFDKKPITDDGITAVGKGHHVGQRSHGFGLMNCLGIIEKYRKTGRQFAVCLMSAESEKGRGSRFFFRLPKGILRCLLIVVSSWLLAQNAYCHTSPMDRAHIYADSAYFSNVNGDYRRTLEFADSCRHYLNLCYRQLRPHGRRLMVAEDDTSLMPPEIAWYHDSLEINYQTILDIRNESAVAALALHDWHLYAYNNKVYTQLFKELSADNGLADYCRMMQQSQQNKRIAMILLLVMLLAIVPAYYMLYYRHRLDERRRRESIQIANIEETDDELRRAEMEESRLHVVNSVLDNCLSALKHETMYYPSRIRQLVDSGDIASLREVVSYYSELYAILSEQAMRMAEQIKLRIVRATFCGHTVLGDTLLLAYLEELLQPTAVDVTARDERYLTFSITAGRELTEFEYLLCRQILRDHGEATHRRACGIRTDGRHISITLPIVK